MSSETTLSARISELSIGGCYVDALSPFPEGTLVKVRIVRDSGVFESDGKVIHDDSNLGMGIAFTHVAHDQRTILEAWLAEIVSQNR